MGIAIAEAEAVRVLQTGRELAALDFWARFLAIDSNHGTTLTAIGKHAYRKGNLDAARTAFQRVVDTEGTDPQQWAPLALVFRNLKDEERNVAIVRIHRLRRSHFRMIGDIFSFA